MTVIPSNVASGPSSEPRGGTGHSCDQQSQSGPSETFLKHCPFMPGSALLAKHTNVCACKWHGLAAGHGTLAQGVGAGVGGEGVGAGVGGSNDLIHVSSLNSIRNSPPSRLTFGFVGTPRTCLMSQPAFLDHQNPSRDVFNHPFGKPLRLSEPQLYAFGPPPAGPLFGVAPHTVPAAGGGEFAQSKVSSVAHVTASKAGSSKPP